MVPEHDQDTAGHGLPKPPQVPRWDPALFAGFAVLVALMLILVLDQAQDGHLEPANVTLFVSVAAPVVAYVFLGRRNGVNGGGR